MGVGEARSAFDRLIVASIPAALRFAIRLTGDPDLAENIEQDTLLRAAKSWQSYRVSQVTTWLFRIVINAFRDRTRRREFTAFARSKKFVQVVLTGE